MDRFKGFGFVIRIEGLSKAFGAKVLFDRVSYHFPPGDRVALVGPNGVGKTTLLNIMCGLEEADAGAVIQPSKCVLGYLPQEPNSRPEDTILAECVAGARSVARLRVERDRALQRMSDMWWSPGRGKFWRASDSSPRSLEAIPVTSRAAGA